MRAVLSTFVPRCLDKYGLCSEIILTHPNKNRFVFDIHVREYLNCADFFFVNFNFKQYQFYLNSLIVKFETPFEESSYLIRDAIKDIIATNRNIRTQNQSELSYRFCMNRNYGS
jgi:hypothetical protein